MFGTIEELEREIEQFQNNMAASGEMVGLLKKMLENFKQQNAEFDTRVQGLLSQLETLPLTIERTNTAGNEKIKSDIAMEFERVLKSFELEQSRYLQSLEFTKQQIQSYIEQGKIQEQSFIDKATMLLAKIDAIPERIVSESMAMLENFRHELDKVLAERNYAFSATQERFVAALGQTKTELKECAEQLNEKYNGFMSFMEKLRITEVYEQNIQLKNELNKRTTLLMIISGVSVILGIVGLIL